MNQTTPDVAVLCRLTDRLQRAATLSELYEAALDAIGCALFCKRASILLFDDADGILQFTACRGLSDAYRRTVEGHSPWTRDVKDPDPILVADVHEIDFSTELKAALEAERIRALAFIPLVENGALIGKFMTYYDRPHGFTSEEIDLAITIARQFSFALGRMRAHEARLRAEDALRVSQAQSVADARALSRLNRLTSRLWTTRDVTDGLEEILEATMAIAGAAMGDIQLFDADRKVLTIAAQLGFGADFLDIFREVSAADDSVCGRALHLHRRVIVEDVEGDERFLRLRPIARAAGFRGVQSTPLIARDGKVLGILSTHFREPYRPNEHDLDRLDLYVQQATDFIERCRIDQSVQHFAAIVESSGDAIVSKDLNGIIKSWNKGAERLFGYPAFEVIGKPVTILMPLERQDEERGILECIRNGRSIESYETVRQRKDGTLIDISLTVSPVKNADGKIVGASKIARDITERKRAEAQREFLVAELSHRVKNTLASVLSIARQTFLKGGSMEDIQRAFAGRVQALAQTHTRLAETSWTGVSLRSILDDELAPYIGESGGNIRIGGPDIELNPRRAIMLGMAVHELATNAAKHGALSSKGGAVEIAWRLGPGQQLVLAWAETGGPKVSPPAHNGFGSLLLGRILPADLRGTFTPDYAEHGLRCEIAIPLDDPQPRVHPSRPEPS